MIFLKSKPPLDIAYLAIGTRIAKHECGGTIRVEPMNDARCTKCGIAFRLSTIIQYEEVK